MTTDEMVPAIWPGTLEIAGAVNRKFAHKFGVPHATILLLVVRSNDCKIAIYIRTEMQTHPGKLDGFGGHVLTMPGITPDNGKTAIEVLSYATCIREGNEELCLRRPDGNPYCIDRENAARHLRLVGQIGEFRTSSPTNMECSSLYIFNIPKGFSINPCDEVDGKTFSVSVKWFSLDELLSDYHRRPESFADGMGRILQRAADDAAFKALLQRMINENGGAQL